MKKKLLIIGLVVGIAIVYTEIGLKLRRAFQRSAAHKLALTHNVNELSVHFQQENKASAGKSPLSGVELNQRAWESSFEERGMSVPPDGPREGYWGSKVSPKAGTQGLRYIERELNIPGLVAVDSDGFQSVGPEDAEIRILILGGSVAYGAYASTFENTYFAKMARILDAKGISAHVNILATGAWVSHDELAAFVLKGLDKNPDIVIFFNGLNDLTNIDTDYERRVDEYLSNMRKAKKIALSYNMEVVYLMQPFLLYKEQKTALEKRLMELSGDIANLRRWYEAIGNGLREFSGEKVHIIDFSTVLSKEKRTTFSDQWHFSDFGHEIIAQTLANHLAEIVAAQNNLEL